MPVDNKYQDQPLGELPAQRRPISVPFTTLKPGKQAATSNRFLTSVFCSAPMTAMLDGYEETLTDSNGRQPIAASERIRSAIQWLSKGASLCDNNSL